MLTKVIFRSDGINLIMEYENSWPERRSRIIINDITYICGSNNVIFEDYDVASCALALVQAGISDIEVDFNNRILCFIVSACIIDIQEDVSYITLVGAFPF